MTDMFEVIASAVAAREAGPARIGQLLGMDFQGPAAGSNDVFAVVRGQASTVLPEMSAAELRVHRRSGAVRLMVFSIDGQVRCVSSADVLRRFGRPADLIVPKPSQPPDAPVYHVFRQPWGDLRVGLSRRPPDCVVAVVADFNVPEDHAH